MNTSKLLFYLRTINVNIKLEERMTMNYQKNEASLQEYSAYTVENHMTWNRLFERQVKSLNGKACKEFIIGFNQIKNLMGNIPDIEKLSRHMYELVGWKLAPVTGLVEGKDYFNLLSKKIFPVAIFIRDINNLDYSPAPDIWHDSFGHLPLLFSSIYQDFFEFISKKLQSANEEQSRQLANLYWYTVEAGICWENGERRVYGASQLSSFQEIAYAMSSEPIVVPFDLQTVIHSEVKIDEIQRILFEIPSFDYLEVIKAELEELFAERVKTIYSSFGDVRLGDGEEIEL